MERKRSIPISRHNGPAHCCTCSLEKVSCPAGTGVCVVKMLDDRTRTPDPELPPELLTWTYEDNITGWDALLGQSAGGDDVSAYAAPARAEDLSGLPPTYLDVGDLDIFRDEDIDYARRLSAAGVAIHE